MDPTKYRANMKAVFETMKPLASAAVFVTTTPYDVMVAGKVQYPAGEKLPWRRGVNLRVYQYASVFAWHTNQNTG